MEFVLLNSPKFSPARILRYMVLKPVDTIHVLYNVCIQCKRFTHSASHEYTDVHMCKYFVDFLPLSMICPTAVLGSQISIIFPVDFCIVS